MSYNSNRASSGLPFPPLSTPREQAHASLAVSSDATALPAVVSTPTSEIPQPFFSVQPSNGSSHQDQDSSSVNVNGHSSALNGVADNLRQIANSSSISSTTTRSSSTKRTNAAVSLQEAAAAGTLHSPVCFPAFDEVEEDGKQVTLQASTASTSKMVLELADGTAFQGFAFGAKGKSISGECVFQTGKLRDFSSPFYPHSSRPIFPCFRMMSVMLAPVSNMPVPYGRAVMKRHNPGIVLLNNKYAMQCPEIEKPPLILLHALYPLFFFFFC